MHCIQKDLSEWVNETDVHGPGGAPNYQVALEIVTPIQEAEGKALVRTLCRDHSALCFYGGPSRFFQISQPEDQKFTLYILRF